MDQPEVKQGEWIILKSDEASEGVHGYVLAVFPDGTLSVGYYQNNAKPIQEDVVWSDSFWKFKYDAPSGSYLRGSAAEIVKRGPFA